MKRLKVLFSKEDNVTHSKKNQNKILKTLFLMKILMVVITLSSIKISFAQTKEQKKWLLRFAQQQNEKWQTERAIAESIAKKLNMPILKTLPDGRTIELQRFENGRPVYYITDNLNAARTISTDDVWPGGSGGFSLTGANETLGVWDAGRVRIEHQEFGGRATQVDGAATNHYHSTHVAGTMIAAGVDPNAKGMSNQGILRAYDWNNDNSEMATAAAAGLKVSNHSYGIITGWEWNYRGDNRWVWFGDTTISSTEDYDFGFYDATSQAWDNIARNAPNYLIVKSAGNDRGEGPGAQPVQHWIWDPGISNWVLSNGIRELDGGSDGYDCISHEGLAKNILTIGAVNDIPSGWTQPSDVVMTSFSCWGHTDDGRIKPDVVGNGTSLYSTFETSNTDYGTLSGTSMSSPNVSGSIGLLFQHRKNIAGNIPYRSSTIKALIIHTADEAGTSSGPDYRFGWGLMSTLKAVQVMTADSAAGGNFNIRQFTLNQNDSIIFQVMSDGTQPLRATICWTDPAGTPLAPQLNPTTPMLVNDLDLRIISASATTYSPWVLNLSNPSAPATTGDNIRDNVEQVHIASPTPGSYTIKIKHKGILSGGSQAVSVVVTGITTLTKDVGSVAILAPVFGIDSAATVVPRCSVYNYGDLLIDSFPVIFRITGPGPIIWTDTQMVYNLDTAVGTSVSFNNWTAGQRGSYTTRCSTAFTTDVDGANDWQDSSFIVQVHDVAVTNILAPTANVSKNSIITPQVRIRNYGSVRDSFNVILTIGAGYVDTMFTSLDAGAQTFVNFTPWTATPVGTHQVRCTTALTGDLITVNDTLSSSVNVYDDDVGVVAIVAPTSTIDSTQTITPRATVFNYGTSPATFPVTFRITGPVNYTNTQNVIALPAGTGITVNFLPWIVGPRGNYATKCSTALNRDTSRANDAMTGTFTIQVHNVGVNSIIAPSGLVTLNSSITPQAVVQNYGSQTETFDVSMVVLTTPPTSWTQPVTLNSGQVTTVTFVPNWTATPIGTWQVRCSTNLANDSIPANNRRIDSVIVYDDDVGVVQILRPVGIIDSTQSITPRCSVYNYGSLQATFEVIYRIAGPASYTNTQTINNLAPGTGIGVNFVPWTVGPRGNYTTKCSTRLARDTSRANDAMTGAFTIQVHDVGASRIIAPRGVVPANAIVVPAAEVRNYGTNPEIFNVSLVILTATPYTSTQSITLNPAEVDTVAFAPPWVAAPIGTYQVRCSTELTSDSVQSNNRAIDSVIVSDADVGVIAILAPIGVNDSTLTITPRCSLYNYGSNPATFPVTFQITGPATYTNTQTVTNLPSNTGIALSFLPWNVGPRGNYWARCTTALFSDTTHRNDTLSSQFEIQVHDVGVTQILAPRGVVPLNGSITPEAVIRNFGSETETFDVSLVVLTAPPSSWTQTITINAGQTDTITYAPAWIATPLGIYQVRCSTDLTTDMVTTNNLKIDTVSVSNDDVGVTAINYPIGNIDSTQTITPQATIYNYGTNSATFPVTFSITGPANYTDTQTVNNLAPSTSITVNFNPWIDGPRGNYTTRCSTGFAIDTNNINDTLSGTFTINVHDVGTDAILAPIGNVSLNSTITPSAIVQNYGTTAETFDVSLTVLTAPPSNWTQTVTLNSGEIDTINFAPPWTATPIGIYQVRCTTSLVSDSIEINNLKIDTVQVVNFDVELISIDYPVGYVDSTATLIPSATVRNYSTVPVSFPATFRINGAVNWADTQMINLNAGQTTTINFDPWIVGPRGGYTTKCTTGLFGDLNPNNNYKDSIFRIRGTGGDVGVTELMLNPSGPSVDSGTVVTITARVRNFGTEVADFDVTTKISTFYNELISVIGLIPGDSITLNFPNWNANQRGTHIVRCTTALAGDVELTNDRQTRSMTVLVRDVRPTAINNPVGNIDSTNNLIVPQVTIQNNGNVPADSFPVLFFINGPVTWTDIQMVRNLPAGSQRTVSFTPWPIGPPGAYTTACSTAWIPDMNKTNDRRTSQFWVQLCDISVESIISPLVVVDSGTTVPVQASVRNRGTSTKNFRTIFRIGTFYDDTLSVTLPPDSGRIVSFEDWDVSQPEAVYPVQCTTVIANDINDVNNQVIDSVRIRVIDVAIESIISPALVIQPGPMTPQTRVRNNGGDLASFYVFYSIISDTGIIYFDSSLVNNLMPDSNFDVSFSAWNAVAGVYIARCSLDFTGDMISANDTMSLIFTVAIRDVGVSRIVYPGSRTLLGPIQPRTIVRNYSSVGESFWTWLMINDTNTGVLVYFDSVFCSNVGPWLERIVDYPRWDTVALGVYALTSYTAMVGDLDPTNDTAISFCSVESIILPRWAQRADVPQGPRNRPVKRGGCITYAGGDAIYAFKGSNTNEFYYYNITSDSWYRRDTIPYSPLKRRRVKRGAALCFDGVNIIYALKGSNTLEFWAYYINGDSWRLLRDVPIGAKKVKGGTGLAYVTGGPSGDLVYCLKGSNTLEFYAYVVAADSWVRLSDVPPGPRNRRMYYGSCMTYDPFDNTIYALKSRQNELYKYHIATDSWAVRSPMPFVGLERAKRVKYGASLAADGAGLIFAFKGNKTREFWIYHTTDDWWEQTEPIPFGPSGRKVKHGGCLCYSTFDQKVYAMKGNRTLEFWTFDASALALAWTPPEPDPSSGTMEVETRPLDLVQFKVVPNPNAGLFTLSYKLAKPGMIEFKLYNVLGEIVFRKTAHSSNSSGVIPIDAKTLASGIYIMRIENGEHHFVGKVLIKK